MKKVAKKQTGTRSRKLATKKVQGRVHRVLVSPKWATQEEFVKGLVAMGVSEDAAKTMWKDRPYAKPTVKQVSELFTNIKKNAPASITQIEQRYGPDGDAATAALLGAILGHDDDGAQDEGDDLDLGDD